MELDPVVIWLIGIVSVAFVGIVRFIAAKTGKKLPTIALQWIAFVVAGAIALTQGFPVIPPLDLGGDPSQAMPALFAWLSDLLVAVAPFFTYATLIYTTLWKAIGDKLVKRVVARFRKPAG